MIYFMLASDLGLVKIGFAQNPRSRLVKLQTDCPCDVVLLAFIEGSKQAESELHSRFSSYRRRGEWFSFEGDLRAFIETLEPAARPEPRVSRLQPLCDAAGIGKGYASQIMSGKQKPPLPLAFHLFKTCGYKHSSIAHIDDVMLLGLADAVPYRHKNSGRKKAA